MFQRFFFFHATATSGIYTLSYTTLFRSGIVAHRCHLRLHEPTIGLHPHDVQRMNDLLLRLRDKGDRKSTRLNSSHPSISYAVFCLKKKTRGQAPLFLSIPYNPSGVFPL